MFIFLIDVDNTIYSKKTGLQAALTKRAIDYMISRLGIEKAEVVSISKRLLNKYGAILTGLIREYGIDPEDFVQVVFDIDVCKFLSPSPALEKALFKLNGRIYAFSDSVREHVEKVLNCLDISKYFSGIYDRRFFNCGAKSDESTYRMVIRDIDACPKDCVLVDDKPENIILAKKIGMTTVWLNEGVPVRLQEADFIITNIHEIGNISLFIADT